MMLAGSFFGDFAALLASQVSLLPLAMLGILALALAGRQRTEARRYRWIADPARDLGAPIGGAASSPTRSG